MSVLKNLRVLVNSDNTILSLNNTSGTGYPSQYYIANGVNGQIFTGGGIMVVATNTNHPLIFKTNRFVNARLKLTVLLFVVLVLRITLIQN